MRTRKHRINFYLSDEELSLLKEKCAVTGFSQSALFRKMLLADQIKVIPTEVVADMQKQFRGIGRNINQIARLAHISGKVSYETLYKIQKAQDKIEQLLAGLN